MSFQVKQFDELTGLQIYKILQARVGVFVVEQQCAFLEVDGKDPNCDHLYFEEDGDILAYARLLPPGVSYKEASIGRVLVVEKARGRGLAKQLLKEAIQYLKAQGHPMIKIQAQSYLKDFYSSFGFAAISDEYLEDDIPHIDMLLTF